MSEHFPRRFMHHTSTTALLYCTVLYCALALALAPDTSHHFRAFSINNL